MCPVALAADPSGNTEETIADYVTADPFTGGRLCFRGHYLAEMTTHPSRLTNAECPASGPAPSRETAATADALRMAASRLADAGSRAAVIVDGNLLTEDVACAVRLAREAVKTEWCAVYLPDTDGAMLRGLSPEAPITSPS